MATGQKSCYPVTSVTFLLPPGISVTGVNILGGRVMMKIAVCSNQGGHDAGAMMPGKNAFADVKGFIAVSGYPAFC